MDKATGTAASAAQAASKAIFGNNTTDQEGGDATGHTQRAGDNAASARRGDSLAFDSSDGYGNRTVVTEPASKSPVLGAPQPSPAFEGAGACGSRFQSGTPVANTTAAATVQAEMSPGDDRTAGERGPAVLSCARDDASTGLMASEELERHLHNEHGICPNAADPTISDRPQTTASSLPGYNPDGSPTDDERSGKNEPHISWSEKEYVLNAGPEGSDGSGAVDDPDRDNPGQGTGTQCVRSTGMAAEGGDFDAAAPGAGREAERLLGEHAVHDSSVDVKNKMHDTAAGNPSISTDTAHSDSGAHENKPSIGERIKEKFHSHHTKN